MLFQDDIIRTNIQPPQRANVRGSDQHLVGDVDMDNISQKKCNCCGEIKYLSDFYKKGGHLDLICKICRIAKTKVYYSQNKTKVIERVAKWATENPERRRKNLARYYENNKSEVVGRAREWGALNPEKVKASKKKWTKENKSRMRDLVNNWRSENPDKVVQYRHNRNARIKNNGGSFTAEEWGTLKEFYNYTCLRCGRAEPEIQLTPDHVLPVAKDGSNNIDNIQPLCLSCNSSKGTKHIDYRKVR